MSTIEQTMASDKQFQVYQKAMMMLGKSAQILAERGADSAAMGFIVTGIELLAKQLRDFADLQDADQEISSELQTLCRQWNIDLPAD